MENVIKLEELEFFTEEDWNIHAFAPEVFYCHGGDDGWWVSYAFAKAPKRNRWKKDGWVNGLRVKPNLVSWGNDGEGYSLQAENKEEALLYIQELIKGFKIDCHRNVKL